MPGVKEWNRMETGMLDVVVLFGCLQGGPWFGLGGLYV